MKIKKIFSQHKADRWLVLAVFALSLFGVLMVYDSSAAIAIRDFSDQYYFVREQLKWLAIGLVVLAVSARVSYRVWYALALPLLIGTLVLLLAVFIPGLGVRALGAHRWLNFGFFILQPAELAKLTLIIYLAAWFSHQEKKRFASFLLLLGMLVGLVAIEPDLGTSIILLGVAMSMYFFSGAPVMHFFLLVPVLAVFIVLFIFAAPYRAARMMTFFNPEHDPQGTSYQIRQVLLAFGSGGWWGVGIGQSRQKYEYLPEANTDSIYAIIGEEIGFVGAAMVVFAYMFIISRGYRTAIGAKDAFGKLLALGVSSWIAIQTIMNMSAMVALIPLTGIPLPLISYGGSSLIILLFAIGIVLNISAHRYE